MKHNKHVSSSIFAAIIRTLGRSRAKRLINDARFAMGRLPYSDRTITRFMAGYSYPLPEILAETIHRIMRTRGILA